MAGLKEAQRTWGNWVLDASTRQLFYEGVYHYHVDLDRCRDSAQVLDWIQHICGKTFAHKDPQCVFDLVCALKEILQIPKGYCEWGVAAVNPVDVKKRIKGMDERQRTGITNRLSLLAGESTML